MPGHTGLIGDITEHSGVIAGTALAGAYIFGPQASISSKVVLGASVGVVLDYLGRKYTNQSWNYNRATSVAVSGAAGAVGGSYLYRTLTRRSARR